MGDRWRTPKRTQCRRKIAGQKLEIINTLPTCSFQADAPEPQKIPYTNAYQRVSTSAYTCQSAELQYGQFI